MPPLHEIVAGTVEDDVTRVARHAVREIGVVSASLTSSPADHQYEDDDNDQEDRSDNCRK